MSKHGVWYHPRHVVHWRHCCFHFAALLHIIHGNGWVGCLFRLSEVETADKAMANHPKMPMPGDLVTWSLKVFEESCGVIAIARAPYAKDPSLIPSCRTGIFG